MPIRTEVIKKPALHTFHGAGYGTTRVYRLFNGFAVVLKNDASKEIISTFSFLNEWSAVAKARSVVGI
jgi:hypothetical protein